MSTVQAKQTAAQYLKDQADIMKKYGEAPSLSGKRYDSALKSTTKTFRTISSAK